MLERGCTHIGNLCSLCYKWEIRIKGKGDYPDDDLDKKLRNIYETKKASLFIFCTTV